MPLGARTTLDRQTVFGVLLAVRLLNALTIKTFFQPDEYYQALEPAWQLAKDSSGAWITWEWIQHLRSAIHPAIFSVVYQATSLALPSSMPAWKRNEFLLYAPKCAQAVIATFGDYYTWQLAGKVYNDSHLGLTALCLTTLNPWQWFCSVRTFSNGLESSLTAAALFYWPLVFTRNNTSRKSGPVAEPCQPLDTQVSQGSKRSLRIALVLAAVATVIRPTNVLIWIVLSFHLLLHNEQYDSNGNPNTSTQEKDQDSFASKLSLLAREIIVCGALVLGISAGVDRLFYGVWTFPALNFLYFNVVQSLAVFYGNNDWHYYLSQGYPLMLTTALPFAIVGLYTVFRHPPSTQLGSPATTTSLKQLATICIALPAALSILSHKEFRFIYPILAPLHVIAAAPVFQCFRPIFISSPQGKSESPPSTTSRSLLLLVLLCLNIIIAGYTSLIHNSGLIALPDYIRTEFQIHYENDNHNSSPQTTTATRRNKPQNLTLGILMPCHSLPWRSHLLNPPTTNTPGIQAWALTCEPPLHLHTPSAKADYLDEADVFYQNPTLWLRKTMSRHPARSFADPNSVPAEVLHTVPHNKHLWSRSSSTNLDLDLDLDPDPKVVDVPGLDMASLLPYLRTSPAFAPRTETEDLARRPWPHYVALFAQLEPELRPLLLRSGYVECWRVFNSHWHDDWRRTGDVVVWCLFPERAQNRQRSGLGGRRDDENEEDRQSRSSSISAFMPQRTGKQRVIRMDMDN